MLHLGLAVIADLGHHRLVALDAVGDTIGEAQLVVVADFCAAEVGEPVDNLVKALLLEIVVLA